MLGVQLVFAGTEGGHIILWDLRGGRNSAAFVAPGEVSVILKIFVYKMFLFVCVGVCVWFLVFLSTALFEPWIFGCSKLLAWRNCQRCSAAL